MRDLDTQLGLKLFLISCFYSNKIFLNIQREDNCDCVTAKDLEGG